MAGLMIRHALSRAVLEKKLESNRNEEQKGLKNTMVDHAAINLRKPFLVPPWPTVQVSK